MQGSEMQKYLNLEKTLSERVIGQDEAIAAVANAIRRNKTGIGVFTPYSIYIDISAKMTPISKRYVINEE